MGLWGRNSSWRSTRDRFGKYIIKINFVRANSEALRRIARRVLREEGIEFEDSAIDALAKTNHGDLRALVRDLQVMTTGLSDNMLTSQLVHQYAEASQRDVSVEIFPGLDNLYRTRGSEEAVKLTRTIDKDPSDFLNWVHWNNASLFTDTQSIRKGSTTMVQADKMLMGRYLNTAHRSTYWTQHLTSLSASVANRVPLQGRIYPSYPHFLRRSAPKGRPSIVEKLAAFSGTNKAVTREDFLLPLMLLTQEDSTLGDPTNFDLSLMLGLTAEEHASLAGLAMSRRSTKDLIKAYNDRVKEEEERVAFAIASQPIPATPLTKIEEVPMQDEIRTHDEQDDGPAPGQATLF